MYKKLKQQIRSEIVEMASRGHRIGEAEIALIADNIVPEDDDFLKEVCFGDPVGREYYDLMDHPKAWYDERRILRGWLHARLMDEAREQLLHLASGTYDAVFSVRGRVVRLCGLTDPEKKLWERESVGMLPKPFENWSVM